MIAAVFSQSVLSTARGARCIPSTELMHPGLSRTCPWSNPRAHSARSHLLHPSGHASNDNGSTTVVSLDHLGIKSLRSAVAVGLSNEMWMWGPLDLARVEA